MNFKFQRIVKSSTSEACGVIRHTTLRKASRDHRRCVSACFNTEDSTLERRVDQYVNLEINRRQLLLSMPSAAALILPGAERRANATEVLGASVYEDPVDKFKLTVPAGWASGQGTIPGAVPGPSGVRRTLAFFPDDPSVQDISVTVVVTNVSVEFTKLSSFGNIDSFADNLVSSQDRSMMLRQPSWARKPNEVIQVAELVSCKATSNKYFVEYTIEKIPGPKRHLYSSFILGSNGRYNRLYTVTGQCLEEDVPKYGNLISSSVASLSADLLPNV
ncbi:hypothetical protein CEUSTIGMA_g13483.t1 [Chlamydomonas eustigma]|uniref:PsbP C-terminal domain-containing protein n=1 Tax=Chlamydomonas eustigma TaxID=1157962 RepID=A0A250XSY3_9CHLO|nr:hypothetical protein CEUSTIGMA_g13483.t1 [Chlamydomonas eustigma]|eukprot:GAX86069.1 hypothetical protein CEUSTIGMA_g13483.t1 [Chlamydomonas eustigma]